MEDKRTGKGSKIVVILLIVAALALVGLAILYFSQQRQMGAMIETMTIEKGNLELEYTGLVQQYDSVTTDNDSLLHMLDAEQQRVSQLLEELRTVKASNALKINQYRKELASLRGVLRSYVGQIDSLNQLNQVLETKNKEITQKFQAANREVEQLSKIKENLSEVVSKASKLEARDIVVTPTTSAGRETGRLSKTERFKVCLVINKNVTAETGMKTVYLRITDPSNQVLSGGAMKKFTYDNKSIQFSASKEVEYAGEDLPCCVYYDVRETLAKGNYVAYLFVDGNLVGQTSFKLD